MGVPHGRAPWVGPIGGHLGTLAIWQVGKLPQGQVPIDDCCCCCPHQAILARVVGSARFSPVQHLVSLAVGLPGAAATHQPDYPELSETLPILLPRHT